MRDSFKLFNFYRRYKWRAQDFTTLQDSVVNNARDPIGAGFAASVLTGLEVAASGGNMALTIQPGTAVAATGYPMGSESVKTVTITAPNSGVRKDLIVMRPKLTDADSIVRPTSPFENVPLTQVQGSEFVVIQGTPGANPFPPTKLANDVVLATVRVTAAQTVLTANDLEFSERESLGKNSRVGQRTAAFDDRLRPHRQNYRTMHIKPSQSLTGDSTFIYGPAGKPAVYPRNISGNLSTSDATLNFQTGAIDGGDALSPDFTPTIPTGNNCIVATVVLQATDTIAVRYGTQGTRAQCLDAIKNQTISGAGAIDPAAGSFKIAFVLIQSQSGSISDITVFDARPLIGAGVGGGGGGGALNWQDTGGNAPYRDNEFNSRPYFFEQGQANELYADLQIPNTYNQGNKIRMYCSFYSTAASGTVDMKTQATLVRNGDAIDSTTNQRTSTNAAYTNTVAKAKTQVEFDLTDDSGNINGVAVTPGATIQVRLYRNGGTDSEATRFRPDLTELRLT